MMTRQAKLFENDEDCSDCGYSLEDEHCEECGNCCDGFSLCEDCEYKENEGE